MADEKCCCNCLHCARWQTSKGIECHCDVTDRRLGYLEVMDTDNDCCRWKKETKWDEQEKHDKEIYNKAIDDFVEAIKEECGYDEEIIDDCYFEIAKETLLRIAEQLKAGVGNDN